MKLRYQMRGLGIGVLVTAILMGVVKGHAIPLTDAEIRAKAFELGMVESGSQKLTDIGGTTASESGNASVPDAAGTDDFWEESSGESQGGDSEGEKPGGSQGEDPEGGNSGGSQGEDPEGGNSEGNQSGDSEGGNSGENRDGDSEGGNSEGSQGEDPEGGNSGENRDGDSEGSQGEDPEGGNSEGSQSGDSEGGNSGENRDGDSEGSHSEASGEGGGEELVRYVLHDETVSVVIEPGADSYMISKALAEAGLVESAAEFDDFLCTNLYSRKIVSGSYEISKGAAEEEIAGIITLGR